MTLPNISPTGEIPLAMTYLAASLANCATWQTWVGADDAAEAAANIWIEEAPSADDETEAPRPLAIISVMTATHARESITDLIPSGTLMLIYEASIPTDSLEVPGDLRGGEKTGDALFWFLNSISAIHKEMESQVNTAGRLNITGIEVQQIARGSEGEQSIEGDYYQAIVQVEYMG